MGKITIIIDTSNAAFEENPGELPLILRELADRIENWLEEDFSDFSTKILAINGNVVGHLTMK